MDGNSSIDLDEGTDGNIICSVKNHVSHTQKTIRLKPCPGENLIHECPDTYENHSNTNDVKHSSQRSERSLFTHVIVYE